MTTAYNKYFNPEFEVSFEAQQISGLNKEKLKEFPTFSAADAQEIVDILRHSKLLIGHFIKSDLIVLRREFDRVNMGQLMQKLPPTECTADLAYKLKILDNGFTKMTKRDTSLKNLS